MIMIQQSYFMLTYYFNSTQSIICNSQSFLIHIFYTCSTFLIISLAASGYVPLLSCQCPIMLRTNIIGHSGTKLCLTSVLLMSEYVSSCLVISYQILIRHNGTQQNFFYWESSVTQQQNLNKTHKCQNLHNLLRNSLPIGICSCSRSIPNKYISLVQILP